MLAEEIRKENKRLYEQGFRQGKLESKLETARALLLNGLSLPLIVKITGLPKEEIEKLQQEHPVQSSHNSTRSAEK